MYFIVFLIIVVCVYISSFKDSFTPENFEKVSPIFLAGVLLLILIIVLDCVM